MGTDSKNSRQTVFTARRYGSEVYTIGRMSDCLSVCPSVRIETTGQMELTFGIETWVSPKKGTSLRNFVTNSKLGKLRHE